MQAWCLVGRRPQAQHESAGLSTPLSVADIRHDVYAMVVAGFSNPLIVLIYVGGMLGLSVHLKHAISNAFQTIGLAKEGHESALRKASPVIAAVNIAGFLAVPVSVVTGLVTVPKPATAVSSARN